MDTEGMRPYWGLDEKTTPVLRVVGLVSAFLLLGLTVLGIFSLRFWPATALSALVILFCVVAIIIIVRRMLVDRRR